MPPLRRLAARLCRVYRLDDLLQSAAAASQRSRSSGRSQAVSRRQTVRGWLGRRALGAGGTAGTGLREPTPDRGGRLGQRPQYARGGKSVLEEQELGRRRLLGPAGAVRPNRGGRPQLSPLVPFNVNAFGARGLGRQDHWLWQVEGAYEFGRFSGNVQSAGFFVAGAGYAWKRLPWRPTLWLSDDRASGDDNPNDRFCGTFDVRIRLTFHADLLVSDGHLFASSTFPTRASGRTPTSRTCSSPSGFEARPRDRCAPSSQGMARSSSGPSEEVH